MVLTTSRAVKESLISKINDDNNLSIAFERATFDPPVMLDATVVDLLDPAKRNTSVRFVAGGESGARVEATLKYNRLSIPKLFQLYSKFIPENLEATTVHGLLEDISERLGFTLEAENFEDGPISGEEGARSFTLIARADSYCFFGQQALMLGEPTASVTIEHNVDATASYFNNEFPNGDYTLWMGAQSHYLKITMDQGPEIVMKGFQFQGFDWNDTTPAPTVEALRDVYTLPALPEYHEKAFQSAQQGLTLAFGQAEGSVFEDFTYRLDYTANYLGSALNTAYNLIQRTAPNQLLQFNLFGDSPLGTTVDPAPPTSWDADTQTYRYVITDAVTDVGFASFAEQGSGIPLDSYVSARITVNALPASGETIIYVNLGLDVSDALVITEPGVYTYEAKVATEFAPEHDKSSVYLGFSNLTSLLGLDAVIEPYPAQSTQVLFQDVATNRLYTQRPEMSVTLGNSDLSLVGVEAQGIRTQDPMVVPMSGSGYPYGTFDLKLTATRVSSGEVTEATVRAVAPDGRAVPTAQRMRQAIQFDNALPTEFMTPEGNWPIAAESGQEVPKMDFVVARTADFQTVGILRVSQDDSIISWSLSNLATDVQNGPIYEGGIRNSEFWVLDFGMFSDDGVPMLSAENTLELELIPYYYLYDRTAGTTTSVPGTPRTFSIVPDGANYNLACPALGYTRPLQVWDEAKNLVAARLNSKDIGVAINADIQQGVNALNSPYGYFRWVLKRKQNGAVVSKFSCSANILVASEV